MNEFDLKSLVGLTLRSPMTAGRVILAANLPVPARWASAVVIVALAGILAWIALSMLPVPVGDDASVPLAWIGSQPLLRSGLQLLAVVLTAGLMAGVGRMFGGQGWFEDALILTVWVEAMLLIIQLVQVLTLPLAPQLSAMLSFVSIGLFFHLTVQFTKVLHGFHSGWKVLLAMIGTMLVFGFLLSFIAAAFGLLPEVPA
ncbi:YIP1 family protein [Paracoccus sp. M683]|uniref:YIP1 family protein n=1 Tax=Paracoccus sp. M683 TaxID=2594268 RepID=UPI0011803D0F|nr:YIP1 family protein [Paracoccus sp. M683]TRW95434.1 YIP1 family protein [Paracoccus sp. M683]